FLFTLASLQMLDFVVEGGFRFSHHGKLAGGKMRYILRVQHIETGLQLLKRLGKCFGHSGISLSPAAAICPAGASGAAPASAARVDLAPSIRSLRRSEEHTSELQSRENLVCRL